MLDAIRIRFQEISRLLNAPDERTTFRTTPEHDGSWHCEQDGETFHFVITERGMEVERQTTRDAYELLYWLVSDVTFGMAIDYELQSRGSNDSDKTDGRNVWMRHQVELLRTVNKSWADSKHLEHSSMLSREAKNDG